MQTDKPKNILVSVEDLRPGGAQVFAMRLSQALHERGHCVRLYAHYFHSIDRHLLQQAAPNVQVIAYGSKFPLFDWLIRKVEGLLRRLGIHSAPREIMVRRHLRRILETLDVDVLNSHTIKSDYVAASALDKRPWTPLIISMHGCYELFLLDKNQPKVIRKSQRALERASAIIYLAEKNLSIFQEEGVRDIQAITHKKIYNGLSPRFAQGADCKKRCSLGVAERDFIFGMVARGIPEKGWAHALTAFAEVARHFPHAHLVLVGEGDYLRKLEREVAVPKVHFVGFSHRPLEWVRLFDVGLLPSCFHAESLPNSIVEYLACGKPAIATRIGEVANMLDSSEGPAGVLLDLDGSYRLADSSQLSAAMRAYLADPLLLQTHQRRAVEAFQKFKMERCVCEYEEVFRGATPAA